MVFVKDGVYNVAKRSCANKMTPEERSKVTTTEEKIQKCMKNVGVGHEEAERILERIDQVLSNVYLESKDATHEEEMVYTQE
jgi:hypothetical protein